MNTEKVITLLILNKGKDFSNSYTLCKVLAWKFKIIACHEIIKDLNENGLINSAYINGMGEFSLTNEGENIITQHWKEAINHYIQEFPNETDFINSFKLA